MPVRGGVAILVGWGAIGIPAVGFIPVAAAAGVVSIFAWTKIKTNTEYGENETTEWISEWVTLFSHLHFSNSIKQQLYP